MREAELRAAQRLGRVGSWHLDLKTDTTTWSEELHRMFGSDPAAAAPSFSLHPQLLAPRSWSVLKEVVDRAMRDGASYSVELEYRRLDGGPGGWVESRGEAIRDAQEAIVGLRGTAHEITDRRRAQEAELQLRLNAQASRDRVRTLRAFSQSIRNSLNAVVGFAHMLKGKVAEGEPQARWVGRIIDASHQIITLLEQMETLDRASYEGGDAPVDVQAGVVAQFENVLARLPCPLLIYNRDGRILHVSRALTESTGYDASELPTRAAWSALVYSGGDAEDIANRLARAFVTRTVADGGERWITTKSGEKRLWHVFAAPAPAGQHGEALFVSIGVDVTPSAVMAAAEAG